MDIILSQTFIPGCYISALETQQSLLSSDPGTEECHRGMCAAPAEGWPQPVRRLLGDPRLESRHQPSVRPSTVPFLFFILLLHDALSFTCFFLFNLFYFALIWLQIWKQKAQYLQHKQNKAEATTVKRKASSSEGSVKVKGSGLLPPLLFPPLEHCKLCFLNEKLREQPILAADHDTQALRLNIIGWKRHLKM